MILDGNSLTVESIAKMARNPKMRVEISPEIEARVKASRKLLDEFVESGRVIYGVTTGVGGFVNWLVPPEYQERLQNNLIRSVASNVGPLLDDDFVRATMLARIIPLDAAHQRLRMKISKNTLPSTMPESCPVFRKKVLWVQAVIWDHWLLLPWLVQDFGVQSIKGKLYLPQMLSKMPELSRCV